MLDKKILAIILGVVLFVSTVNFMGYYLHEEENTDYSLRVIVTIPPQKEFVDRIGGEDVKVTVMVPPGEDPHSYEPTPNQMEEVAKADIYFKIGSGMGFEENYISKMKEQNAELTVVDGSEGIELRNIGNSSGKKDPHIWLSPVNARKMVNNLKKTMKREDPDNADLYEENADSYTSKLSSLDKLIENSLKTTEKREFMVYHPSFGYFADEFNLTQVPIEEEGKEPGTKGLNAIIEQAKEKNITAVFVSPQFDKNNAQTIADEIDGKVISLNPLASDYLENLLVVSSKLIDALN